MTTAERQTLTEKLALLRENIKKPQGKHAGGHIRQMQEAIVEIEGKIEEVEE